jgi:hypothetical protein
LVDVDGSAGLLFLLLLVPLTARRGALEQHDAPAPVSRGEVGAVGVELDRGDYVGWGLEVFGVFFILLGGRG